MREIKSAWLHFEQTNSRGFNVVALVSSCRAYRTWMYGWLNVKHRERERQILFMNRRRKERVIRGERKSTTSIPFHHKMAECKQSQLHFFPVAPVNLSVISLTHIQSLSLSLSLLSILHSLP